MRIVLIRRRDLPFWDRLIENNGSICHDDERSAFDFSILALGEKELNK
jgi:hypothetical protein